MERCTIARLDASAQLMGSKVAYLPQTDRQFKEIYLSLGVCLGECLLDEWNVFVETADTSTKGQDIQYFLGGTVRVKISIMPGWIIVEEVSRARRLPKSTVPVRYGWVA